MGGEAKQYQVVLDPKRLAGYRLSLGDIARASSSATTPSSAAATSRRTASRSSSAATPSSRASRTSRTPSSPSDADGTPVLIKQRRRRCSIGPALRFGAVTKHGEGEIVAGTVMMLIGANSREVVHAVKARLAEIQKELPEGVEIRSYYDRAEFIGRMLQDRRRSTWPRARCWSWWCCS